jgi:hypothetical protein
MDEKRTPGAEQSAPTQTGVGARTSEAATRSTTEQSRETLTEAARAASDTARTTYDQGRRYVRDMSERYPQARRYYERGSRAVGARVSEAPLLSLLAVGAAGYLLAWAMQGGRKDRSERMLARARKGDLPGYRTGKPLIESDRVEGTTVYDLDGNHIGTIKRVMIDKISGRVAYAVMSFGGFLGLGSEEYAVPWSVLDYDTELGGYRTDLTEDEVQHAPSLSQGKDFDWSDARREQQLHDYYGVTYYWLVP